MNIFKLRALDFIYCSNYIPEIDNSLSSWEYQRDKTFWASPFDIIIIPIGFCLLYRDYIKIKEEIK